MAGDVKETWRWRLALAAFLLADVSGDQAVAVSGRRLCS